MLERAPEPQKGGGAAYVDEREKERNTSTILSLTDAEKFTKYRVRDEMTRKET